MFKLRACVTNRDMTPDKKAHFTATVISEDQTHVYTQNCTPAEGQSHITEFPAFKGELHPTSITEICAGQLYWFTVSKTHPTNPDVIREMTPPVTDPKPLDEEMDMGYLHTYTEETFNLIKDEWPTKDVVVDRKYVQHSPLPASFSELVKRDKEYHVLFIEQCLKVIVQWEAFQKQGIDYEQLKAIHTELKAKKQDKIKQAKDKIKVDDVDSSDPPPAKP